MKGNECKSTLQTSLKWQIGAFCFWSVPLVYICLYFSPMVQLYPPQSLNTYLFTRFYILIGILLGIKYMTISNFPDVSTWLDELRKLFTSINPFHMNILISGMMYPMLFKELGLILGYSRINSWGNFYATGLGIGMSVVYLLRHDYINYWYDPPYSRVHWVCLKVPEGFITSIIGNFFLTIGLSLIWMVWKYEIPGYDYYTYGVIVYFVDYLMTKVLCNFLAKPTRLDDENTLGEELAISGLLIKSPDVHFQCLQDLSRASNSRKLQIIDPKTTQWSLLQDTCLNYISSIPRHIQNYTTLKNKENVSYHRDMNYSLVYSLTTNLYFVFNEPFEVRFRNELFKMFTMAALASRVLTKFVVAPGMNSYVLKDNSLSCIIQAQADTIAELDKYTRIDPSIIYTKFRDGILFNLADIKAVYGDYLSSISLRGEALQTLYKLGSL
jgi:hypothetical protein